MTFLRVNCCLCLLNKLENQTGILFCFGLNIFTVFFFSHIELPTFCGSSRLISIKSNDRFSLKCEVSMSSVMKYSSPTFRSILLFISLICISNCVQSKKTISCKKLARTTIYSARMCVVNNTEKIDSETFEISSTATATTSLVFTSSWHISYLPVKMGEVFPHLQSLDASGCLVKEISPENFDGLGKLADLRLPRNRIKTIAANTFKSLVSLRNLDLSE